MSSPARGGGGGEADGGGDPTGDWYEFEGELERTLRRPDLAALASHLRVRVLAGEMPPYLVPAPGELVIGRGMAPPVTQSGALAPMLREAMEAALLRRLWPTAHAVCGLAALRTAALFRRLERVAGLDCPERGGADWVAMGGPAMPGRDALESLWRMVRARQPGAPEALTGDDRDRLAALWPVLGPVEWLMQQGGDARLAVDPRTGLNHYGCSHRPRPWAVTFASSTASSVSERGTAAAEVARRRLLDAFRRGHTPGVAEAASIRAALAVFYRLPPLAGVVLAPSGTDASLFTFAVSAAKPGGRPVLSLLLAADEVGRGVPLAASGRHFDAWTARGAGVCKGEPVEGLSPVEAVRIPAREPDGTPRSNDAVERECAGRIRAALDAGRDVLIHAVDVSKTGLLTPGEPALLRLRALAPARIDVVVDACQARLMPEAVHALVAAGWMVQVTGSKFFTGPPFAGALLLPEAIVRRLDAREMPRGLRDYTSRAEWPAVIGTEGWPTVPSVGLLLRWRAALGELAAFRMVPPATCRDRLTAFLDAVRDAIEADPGLRLVTVPALDRGREGWDSIGTILCFAVTGPDGTALGPEAARKVYEWLNADLEFALNSDADEGSRALARKRCHIGQPVPVRSADGASAGILRISAGARLVSGEPWMSGMPEAARMAREIADARDVLRKIGLILSHWDTVARIDPQPTYL